MTTPLVSVCMITYNHEKYILKAIEGVLMQRVNFHIEFIICNDNSTDDTHLIISSALKDCKNITINYYCHSENKGMMPNFIFALEQCNGKYIALCEGDDYWTDPLKLQKQVDFLEQNKKFVMCYHNAKIVDENNQIISESKLPLKSQTDFEAIQLKTGAFVLTLTICFRNVIKEFPPEIYKVLNGDTFLFSVLGQFGKGKYINNIDNAVYRMHNNGIWSRLNNEQKKESLLNTAIKLKKYYQRLNDSACVFIFGERIKALTMSILTSKNTRGRNRILYSFAKKLNFQPIFWFFLYKISFFLFDKGYYFQSRLRKAI